MTPRSFRKLGFVGIALGLVAVLLVMGGTTLEYWRFLTRDREYYMRVAEACDKLRMEHARDLPVKMSGGKLDSLPIVLHNLDPSFVIVDTNCVSLLIGGGFDAYHILWVPDEPDGAFWQLKAFREGSRSRTVFSQVKTTQ
jgi:hypothetical protein